jgi:16S rRNA (guanine527-N7)-methyltransferase
VPGDAGDAAADALRLAGIDRVSRETIGRLTDYVDLVGKWQRATNLVAPATLSDIWRRHVADSAQLVPLHPLARTWLDLGSGGGFPGIVIAILVAEAGGRVDLVESDTRKSAFLRQAIRSLALPAAVHQGRIETVLAAWPTATDLVVARALAPLPQLLDLIAPLASRNIPAAFPKGRDHQAEIAEASRHWQFDLEKHKSRIEDGGVILGITHLRPRPRGRPP